jgi:predicted O-linked N-acetylglucosamine transferase (SPINDLY family)
MPSPAKIQQLLQEAVAHHRAGRLDQAEAFYRRVRAAQPNHFDALHLSGMIALQQGRAPAAVELLSRAHRASPKNAVCALRYGLALIASGRSLEAEPVVRLATQLDPDRPEAWDNLAYCLKTQDRLREAIECHQRAVALKPDFAVGWYNYGLTLSLHGDIAGALCCHERALAADPAYANGHYGRAQALQQAHRIDEAIAAYGRFLALQPGHHEARSYRLFALNNVDALTREELFAEHAAYGRAVGEFPVPQFPNAPGPERRLRVAFLSPDLRAHSCAFFIEPLLRHLDPAQFEIYLYHDHFREDEVSQRLRGHAAVWRRFVGLMGPQVEQIIRADAPDILVDLAGHTGMTNRLPLFARHLAPVQVTYLGYPNTTGLPAMQYRFTDAIADPAGEADAFATEKLVRFAPTAWAYEPPEFAPEPNAPPCATGKPVTFGCFNNLTKFTDAQFRVWARLLAAVPDARLVFKGRGLSDEAVRERYFGRFAAAGLPLERVELLERTAETKDHLALYHRVDIALDTFPYNGTTTTCEALWMGVPVVAVLGDRHAARVSASLLTAVGHPEWIAADTDDYVRLAAELAADPARLAHLRANLRGEMVSSALLDHAGQAALFGEALRACWREWCAERSAASDGSPAAELCAAAR